MKILSKLFDRLEDYIVNILAPSFGVLCAVFGGNWQTRVLGITILILDFIGYNDNRG